MIATIFRLCRPAIGLGLTALLAALLAGCDGPPPAPPGAPPPTPAPPIPAEYSRAEAYDYAAAFETVRRGISRDYTPDAKRRVMADANSWRAVITYLLAEMRERMADMRGCFAPGAQRPALFDAAVARGFFTRHRADADPDATPDLVAAIREACGVR